MNGFKLTQTGIGGVITITGNKTFTLKDSSEAHTGTITGGSVANYGGGGVNVGNGCTFNLTGGTIADCSAKEGGGIFTSGTTNIVGGTITNCSADIRTE